MGKILDKILFSFALLVVAYVFASTVLDKKSAVYVAVAVYLFAVAVYLAISAKRPKYKGISPSELPVALAIMGTQKATDLFYATLPEQNRIYEKAPYFAYEWRGLRYLVCVAYKFINLTQEDIAGAYREAQKSGIERVVILTRGKDRKTLTLCALLPVTTSFPDKHAVYRYLKRHNALPEKPKTTKNRIKIDLKESIGAIFEPQKAKYYLFLSVIFALLSFFTPLKTYYLVFSIIPLTLSAISLILRLKE